MLPIDSRLINSKAIEYTNRKAAEMSDIIKSLGFNIRKLREKKGWSQEQLAFEADLHRAYIGQIERGEKNIGVKNLEKIAKALNISLPKLLKF